MRRAGLAVAFCLGVAGLGAAGLGAAPVDRPLPSYTAQAELRLPAQYRDWIFLSSGIDMRYSAHPQPVGAVHEFDNVFAQPFAVAAFRRSGHWPEGTMLVLENRSGTGRGSINRAGVFQTGEVTGLEVHVHDSAHLPGGWGFFSFEGTGPAKLRPRSDACYACHQAHGAVDTSFVQFYPTLLPIARQFGTLNPAARADGAGPPNE